MFDPVTTSTTVTVHLADPGRRRRAARRVRRGALYGGATLLAFAAIGLLLTVIARHPTPTRTVADPDASTSAAPSPDRPLRTVGCPGSRRSVPLGRRLSAPVAGSRGRAATPPAPTRSTAKPPGNTSYEDQVVTLVNQERAKAGCNPLTVDSRLITAARGHSQDMATRNYFDHNTPEGVTPVDPDHQRRVPLLGAAENIAAGSPPRPRDERLDEQPGPPGQHPQLRPAATSASGWPTTPSTRPTGPRTSAVPP